MGRLGGRADADRGALQAGCRPGGALLGREPTGARWFAGRLLPDHRLQSQVRHQRAPRPPTQAPLAAQAASKALRQTLPDRTEGDLGGRWLYLCRAPASLPARPAAAARASRPTLAGGGDQRPVAGRQHLHHRSQPGSAPPAAALAKSQPQAAQPAPGRGAGPGAELAREERPGYLEMDLVSHSGRWAIGDWIYTLSATDLETGWSELVPVMTKSKREVLAAFA